MKKILCLLLFAFIGLSPALAGDILIKGIVTCDKKGVEGVWVTDGETFARTDSKGRYKMIADNRNHFIHICIPKGYDCRKEKGVARFFEPMPEGKKAKVNFELFKTAACEDQTIIVTADPQIAMEKEFAKLKSNVEDIKETIESYKEKGSKVHGICAGDLTANKYAWFEKYNLLMDSTGINFRNAMGNHDFVNFGRSFETSFGEWEKVYGPAYFSYDIGDVHYVFLNDNFYIGRQWYYIAYLDEKQLSWLEKDLSHVAPGSTVFTVFHIPATCEPEDRKTFKYNQAEGVLTNAEALFKLLKPFDAHIINGHTHTTYNQIVRDNLYVHVIPGLCGAWWQGPICTDGTPIGYTVFEIKKNKVKNFYYKTIGKPKSHQIKLYTERDTKMYEGYAVANVWAWDESWKIEFVFDGDKTIIPEKFQTIDYDAKQYYSSAKDLDYKWVGPTASDHYFRCPIPKGAKRIEVKVTDRFGTEYSENKEL